MGICASLSGLMDGGEGATAPEGIEHPRNNARGLRQKQAKVGGSLYKRGREKPRCTVFVVLCSAFGVRQTSCVLPCSPDDTIKNIFIKINFPMLWVFPTPPPKPCSPPSRPQSHEYALYAISSQLMHRLMQALPLELVLQELCRHCPLNPCCKSSPTPPPQ